MIEDDFLYGLNPAGPDDQFNLDSILPDTILSDSILPHPLPVRSSLSSLSLNPDIFHNPDLLSDTLASSADLTDPLNPEFEPPSDEEPSSSDVYVGLHHDHTGVLRRKCDSVSLTCAFCNIHFLTREPYYQHLRGHYGPHYDPNRTFKIINGTYFEKMGIPLNLNFSKISPETRDSLIVNLFNRHTVKVGEQIVVKKQKIRKRRTKKRNAVVSKTVREGLIRELNIASYECFMCSKIFTTEEAQQDHMASVHGQVDF